MGKRGYLILENGKVFEGYSFGWEKEVSGEVVFNTGMTGYPESFTDPSYYGQILTMTYPLIGNYGVPPKTSFESDRIQIRGLIVSSYIDNKSHWQSVKTLADWLKEEKVPGLYDIDTRTLTKIIREFGVMKGNITFNNPDSIGIIFDDINDENLIPYVSCKQPKIYGNGNMRILLIDCGVKNNIIRLLLKKGATVIRVPWNWQPFQKGNKYQFDAILVSNGPGDPKMAKATIATLKEAIRKKIPIIGICLGNQILALAAGADTYKLKYGHRGQNQPVRDLLTGRCYITTQNHGYAAVVKTLPANWLPWLINLNDSTNEGIRHCELPFFSMQFHPEATPGPTDTEELMDGCLGEIKKWLKKN